jgi:peptide/nickel transport system permease protein
MTAYIIRRLIQALVVIIIVTLLVFFIMRLLPGDPLMLYLSETQSLETMPPEAVEKLRHEFGLDKPLILQYVNWMSGILRGDFGTSIYYRESVGTLMLERYPITLHLGVLSFIFSGILGILAGLVAALRRGKWIDTGVTVGAYLGISIPVFWLGILLMYALGLKLHWLPISGYTSPLDDFWLSTRQVIMPVICMSLMGVAATARQMRSSMLEVIRQDYIRTAWSKGLRERNVVFSHALKNSLIPVVTLIGMFVPMILVGSVFAEVVFAIPGIGRLLVSSIFGHDYVVVQSITLLIAVVVVLCNLIVDVSYGWLDPRIRYG